MMQIEANLTQAGFESTNPGRDVQRIGTARFLGQDLYSIHHLVWAVMGNLGDSQCYLGVDQGDWRRPTLKRRFLYALGAVPRRDDRAPHGVEVVQRAAQLVEHRPVDRALVPLDLDHLTDGNDGASHNKSVAEATPSAARLVATAI
jgi:hypothetical protein